MHEVNNLVMTIQQFLKVAYRIRISSKSHQGKILFQAYNVYNLCIAYSYSLLLVCPKILKIILIGA